MKKDQIKKDEMSGTCTEHAGMRNVYKMLVGKLEGKRPLGRTRRRWKNSIKTDKDIMWDGTDWIHLAQDMDRWLAL
jgi:hypothetical protein